MYESKNIPIYHVRDENGGLYIRNSFKNLWAFADGRVAEIPANATVSMNCFGFTPSFCNNLYDTAYNRIRSKVRNGLAVVTIKRDACSGCFNRIPPQRQADIRLGKKLIVCEYCGRILVPGDEE